MRDGDSLPAPVEPPAFGNLPPFQSLDSVAITALAPELAWIALPGGQVLFKAGEPAEAFYIVVAGALGVLVDDADGNPQLLAEIHSGATAGEMALMTDQPHSVTIAALRHTELYALPKAVFERLVAAEPGFLKWIARQLVDRLRQTTLRRPPIVTRRTVALVPADPHVPVAEIAEGVLACLKRHNRTAKRVGPAEQGRSADWFEKVEAEHELIVYQVDPPGAHDGWNRFCCRQADRIVLIAQPGTPLPDPLPFSVTDAVGRRTVVDLVMVEPLGHGRTASVPKGAERFGSIFHIRPDVPEDVARFGRHLAGLAMGIVLGGGAARGFAHIGAIKALREAGLPIDRIGGTSMGAIVAAGVAAGWDDYELRQRMHRAFVTTNPLNDYTIPWIALFRGARVDALLRQYFGHASIEELWRPYFCISTNLTHNGLHVHRRGELWRALRASVAIPGVLPPLLENNEVLVDGGVIDNLPVDVMAADGPGPIIAIDVAGDQALTPGSEVPLNRRGLMGWLRPDPGPFPDIVSVLSRVGTVSSAEQGARARARVSLLIEPSLATVPLLDWRAFDRAVDAGYQGTIEALATADRDALSLPVSPFKKST